MPNCTSTNTSTKARNPLLSFLSKNSQKSPYWKLLAAPIENSQGAYFQQKRERTTTRDSDKVKKKKKKKMYPPRGETNVSRNSYQEIPSPRPAFTGATCLAAWKNAIFRTTCEYVAEIQERNAYEGGIQFSLSLLRFARIYHTKQKRGEAS